MIVDINEIKKSIANDWIHAFSELTAFTQNKFYKIAGCLLLGIECVNIPNIEGYKPHFVIYPLWKENIKKCLDIPSIYICEKNEKGMEFSIPYLKHSSLIPKAIECFKKQIPILLNGDITLKSLIGFIDNISQDILIKTNSAEKAKLFELKLYAALYLGDQAQVETILNEILQSSKNWNMQMFEIWYGKFDIWFQGLKMDITNRENFLRQIQTNKKDKKLIKLKASELTA